MKAQHTFRFWAREALRRALPTGAYARLDQARRWRCYRRARIVFVHVPKASGSAISTVLYGGRLGHHPARELALEDHASWDALEKFAMVREPVARFLSAFAYALSGGTQEGAIRWRAEYGNPAYRDVNAFVLEYLSRDDIFAKDVVFWPQTHFVCDDSGRTMPGLRLFTTGEFDRLEEFLAQRGFAALPRMNRGRPAPDLGLELGQPARGALESVYASDFELFGRLGTGE